jgi:hypothetical protein
VSICFAELCAIALKPKPKATPKSKVCFIAF